MNNEQWQSAIGSSASGMGLSPHPWQLALAAHDKCTDRLIRIPTGFGKTLGVLCAWLHHRVDCANHEWPARLVWCLPMRVLAEQIKHEIGQVLDRRGLLWDGIEDHNGKVGVHVLMGGVGHDDWHLHPEHPAVLIGTQDMLLSRALNRGYASPRARRPMEFGLLNQDCLWVMDEVQLMDVGLATSGQLQAFRNQDERSGKSLRPSRTWWMSATLQPEWLALSPETRDLAASLTGNQFRIAPEQRTGLLWDGVTKPCHLIPLADASELAQRVAQRHIACGSGANGPTLVVVNTVRTALDVHSQLSQHPDLTGADLRLVHSRFRPVERAAWRDQFLTRPACAPGTNRIIVATQVIEAGVDISAGLLITELAPWTSLVQRFGRAARWGGSAEIDVIDFQHSSDKAALPYALAELDAARTALTLLEGVAPLQLEAFEEAHPELLAQLYPYAPRHLLLRHELDELFDTTPDLSGADVDISRFIRSGEERDLHVFWPNIAVGTEPNPRLRASRDALCNVPFLAAREWLCGKETASSKAPRLKPEKRAWIWDYLDGKWRTAERKDLYPGQTVLVAAQCGGYLPSSGWAPDSRTPVEPVEPHPVDPEDLADASEDDESLSAAGSWQTIAVHGAQVGCETAAMAATLDPDLSRLLELAGRWHDTGKALAPFQNSITGPDRPQRRDLAKAPDRAWLQPASRLYPDPPNRQRRGFRHELASTLALFAVLIRHQPDHPALLGPWRGLLELAGMPPRDPSPPAPAPNVVEQEILKLSAEQFDLLAYLVCSHHGKVRMAWHASPADQQAGDSVLRLRGVRDGEVLPSISLATADGGFAALPQTELHLDAASAGLNPRTGRGWTERVLDLLQRHGPFALAYLEALLRAADQRASRNPVADPLIGEDNANNGLETRNREVAQSAGGGESSPTLAAHSPERGTEHGIRGGAGESGDAGGGTRPPSHATRYLETSKGRLSYLELAPLLATEVALIERAIELGEYDDRSLDESLLLDLHSGLCRSLVPNWVGWRKVDVVIGHHEAPSFFRVPELMRSYALDLAERERHLSESGDALIEYLAFAEGRLLSIHPFTDFNGRATRLFLRLILRRKELPAIDLVPAASEVQNYLAALGAADHSNWKPLGDIWRKRLAQEPTP